MIAIVDYGMGNLRSVQKALEKSGAANVKITCDKKDINKADKLVVPGVGAMGEAIIQLNRLKLTQAIKDNITQKPFLGICLGLQLLFDKSQEGKNTRGLNILSGEVKRFGIKMKVPHMGWNNIEIKNTECPILKGIPPNSYFYFCHSYYVVPKNTDIIAATTDYGTRFASIVYRDRLFALQFHPEKSQDLGLTILRNFVELS